MDSRNFLLDSPPFYRNLARRHGLNGDGCAAGAVEAMFSVLALHTGIIPPTITLENPSEGWDLDYVPNAAREAKVDVVVSNGFGFGGTNGTLVFRRV